MTLGFHGHKTIKNHYLSYMKNRRAFIKASSIGAAGALIGANNIQCKNGEEKEQVLSGPLVLSTWDFGIQANQAAWKILSDGGSALDAVEAGVRITESDAENISVGIGGLPDRLGITTLDACIQDHNQRCGSVAFLQNIEHPVSVARKIMEDTEHVMLVGKGAYDFAIEKGFPHKDLSTTRSIEGYEEWKKTAKYKTIINRENHDTIGMIAMDKDGNLSGACTTSGMAYKMHGRVGDSPIIGAGLFVDNEVGAATATGVGEAVIRVAGAAIVVELMRQGKSPTEACKEVVLRIQKKHKSIDDLQVGFIAINKKGEYGGFSVYSGFEYAVKNEQTEKLMEATYLRVNEKKNEDE